MSGIPGIPQNLIVQQANQKVLVSWDLSPGADSYVIQRSLDNVTYSTLVTVSGSPLATSYLDSAVALNTQYWYQVSAVNVSGASSYTNPLAAVPTPTGEMSLGQIRLAAQQRADRVNSKFVTTAEWNSYINQSMYELYDLLVTVYEDYYIAPPIQFNTNGNAFQYPLPNGSNSFLDMNNQVVIPRPFYKLIGVDLAVNAVTNSYVSLQKFNFIDRNKYIYSNSTSTIYGIYNMRYRLMGNNIDFIPTPTGNQLIRLWYVPRLTELLQDTDTTDTGISGWIEYVVVKAAYYALTKEESDTTSLVMQLGALQKRIEETAASRDAGIPDTVSATRSINGWGGEGGWNGGHAGW